MKAKKRLGGLTKELILELKKSDLKIECRDCKQLLPFNKFTQAKNKNGLYYTVYECNKCGYKRRMVKHGHKYDSYNKTQLYRQRNTVEGRASYLLYGVKRRVKVNNYEFNLTKEFIQEKLEKGVCEATGITLDLQGIDYKPYAPSIDRIDFNKGYTKDNIQITSMIYNFCKNKFSDIEVKTFIKDAYTLSI